MRLVLLVFLWLSIGCRESGAPSVNTANAACRALRFSYDSYVESNGRGPTSCADLDAYRRHHRDPLLDSCRIRIDDATHRISILSRRLGCAITAENARREYAERLSNIGLDPAEVLINRSREAWPP